MMIHKDMVFLVVDDFEPMRKVTATQLRALGANTIITANDGAEALRILRQQRVDVVLSDWNMPVMNGLELLKAIRADHKLAQLPFIMITAEVERARIEEVIAAGVSDLLVKPYTADRLVARLQKALTIRPRPVAPVVVKPVVLALPESVAEDDAIFDTSADVIDDGLPAMPKEAPRPTILVVDDTPDNLHLLVHLFKDEYKVRVSHNGEKALEICQSNNPPDLVLLDIMMPGMNGFEVVQAMRAHPTSESIPVIFVSAMNTDDARLKGLELGAVDFVTKPIDPALLKPRVRNFMRYVELRKQLQADYDGMLETARLREDVEHITRHDMRGPLAGVIGMLQALVDDDSMSRKQTDQLRLVEETALQVLNMINLSSELFKIETGRFKLNAQPVKVADILRRMVEMARTVYAEKRLAIVVDTDVPASDMMPIAMGDGMLCYSIFQNLLKNACEAAPPNSRVSVTLNNETPIRIIFQNKGVVPLRIRENFFDKFATFGKQSGSGLGTYSAKLLSEAQHGSIALKVSDEENQTTITVTLPRQEAT
jgi:two-component system sensor histidine kinase/response regulator